MEDTTTVVEDNTVGTVEDTSQTTETTNLTDTMEEQVEHNTDQLVMTVDDLLTITEDQYPEFGDDNHTGMPPLHEVMKHLPENARKHLANIRRSYTQKTQELAAMKLELQTNAERHLSDQALVYDNELNKRLQDITSREEQFDIYSEEGMKSEIQRQAAKMMQDMLQPARDKITQETRRFELQKFKDQNPELTDPEYRNDIAQMLTDRPELKLEDAFYIVKAKLGSAKLEEERKLVQEQRQNRRETFNMTSNGSTSSPKTLPKFNNAWEAFQYHKAQQDV